MFGFRKDYGWPETAIAFGGTCILGVLAVTSLLLRYVMNPVTCFCPAQFEASQVDYAQTFCYQSARIYLPRESIIPSEHNDVPLPQSTYHQWLPLFLGVLCSMCLLPHLTWTLVRPWLWADPHHVVTSLATGQHRAGSGTTDRHGVVRDWAVLMHAGLGQGGRSILTIATLGRKALGCVVCFLQMLLIGLVFEPRLNLRQIGMTGEDDGDDGDDQRDGGGGSSSSVPLPVGHFHCFFKIQHLQNVHEYAVQCVMPLAQVYTKGLVFLVYLFLILFILSAVDLALCTLPLVVPRLKDVTLARYLSVLSQSGGQAHSSPAHASPHSQSGGQNEPIPAHCSRFLGSLGVDGRWVLGVVKDNCGDLAACDLTVHLFQIFKSSPHSSAPVMSPADSQSAARAWSAADKDGDASVPFKE